MARSEGTEMTYFENIQTVLPRSDCSELDPQFVL